MIDLKKLKEAEYKKMVKITLNNGSIFIGETKEWQQPEEDGEEYNLTIKSTKNNGLVELKQSEIKEIEIIEK